MREANCSADLPCSGLSRSFWLKRNRKRVACPIPFHSVSRKWEKRCLSDSVVPFRCVPFAGNQELTCASAVFEFFRGIFEGGAENPLWIFQKSPALPEIPRRKMPVYVRLAGPATRLLRPFVPIRYGPLQTFCHKLDLDGKRALQRCGRSDHAPEVFNSPQTAQRATLRSSLQPLTSSLQPLSTDHSPHSQAVTQPLLAVNGKAQAECR